MEILPKKYKIGVAIDPIFQNHLTPPHFPESPARIGALLKTLQTKEFFRIPLRKAHPKELALCHNPAYIELVKNECQEGRPLLSTGDVYLSKASYEVACYAVGAVLEAVDRVMAGAIDRAFCAVRPPGHHASSSKGEGFCLFNNVAIGVRYAQEKYGLGRVLIVDWDVHHGNGTEAIFRENEEVFYISTHQSPSYPGTGFASAEHLYNFPITPEQSGKRICREVYGTLLPKLMEKFQPEIVFISAGFDARKNDPLGFLNLEDEDFAELTKSVGKIHPRIISVLEGGYDLMGLSSAVLAHLQSLKGG